jgi:hypothetical protein
MSARTSRAGLAGVVALVGLVVAGIFFAAMDPYNVIVCLSYQELETDLAGTIMATFRPETAVIWIRTPSRHSHSRTAS